MVEWLVAGQAKSKCRSRVDSSKAAVVCVQFNLITQAKHICKCRLEASDRALL